MRLFSIVFLLFAATPAMAQSLLHPMFADHAVLQRDQPLRIYGAAPAKAAVTVRIAGQSATARAGRDGIWQVVLPPLKAGGPYVLEAQAGTQSQAVRDVLVGDVYLCTGQSNMQISVLRAANAAQEIAAAKDDAVRELAIDLVASPTPLTVFSKPISWKVESPQTAGNFSASCFYFARDLRKKVNVPIGLITAAWGGTRVRGWVSEPGLRKLGYFNADLDMLATYRRDPVAASKQWDAAWENWWRANGNGEPWKTVPADWPLAPAGLGSWGTWPALAAPDGTAEEGVGFVGQMWFATHVTLSAAQAAKPATLDFGRVSEEEKSWVNGTGIGGTSIQPAATHVLPQGLLRAGDNTIVLNVFCSWRNCGLMGDASTRALRFADGTSVPLDQPWRYKPVETLIAPQLPWGPMHGTGLQYNGMIAPIGPYGVRAAIWYQGESNLYFAQTYQKTLTAMMADWRGQFGAKMPFLVVQIPNYGLVPTRPGPSLWSDVREAQRRTVEADGNAALVVTYDIGDPKVLHPSNKQEVGHRIAVAARHLVHGEAIAPSGPRVASAQRAGDTVRVTFRDVTGSLAAQDGVPMGFQLCDAGGCRAARASLSGNGVTLSDAAQATRLRYCWGDSPVCSLTDATTLPAGPFEVAITPPS